MSKIPGVLVLGAARNLITQGGVRSLGARAIEERSAGLFRFGLGRANFDEIKTIKVSSQNRTAALCEDRRLFRQERDKPIYCRVGDIVCASAAVDVPKLFRGG
jgi:hypothetical protein